MQVHFRLILGQTACGTIEGSYYNLFCLSLGPNTHLQIHWEANHAPVQCHIVLVKFLVRADVPVEHHSGARSPHERRCPHLMCTERLIRRLP